MARSSLLPAEQAPQQLPFIDLAAQRARIGPAIDRAMARVVEHGQFILGPEVAQLEEALSEFCGARHCVTCANGTDALTIAMMARGIGPGDAVFVPSFTFVATAESVAQLGAVPVFVDIEPDTFNLAAASLERAIAAANANGLKPRMAIAVDLYGQPADYDAVAPIAHAHGMALVADAAQSFGAQINGRKVGTLADITTTSFFPAKPLGCYGDGGAIFAGDDDEAAVMRSIRQHGQGAHKYENARVGVNSRLDTLQAAVLLEKLKIFPDEIAARNRAAERYEAALEGIVGVPHVPGGFTSVWAQYTILLPAGADREGVRASCAKAGVPTAIYYPLPLHRQACYAGYPHDPAGLVGTDTVAPRVLSLPMHPYLDEATQDVITAAVVKAVRG